MFMSNYRQVTSQIQVELLQIYFRESSPQPAALNKQVNDPAFWYFHFSSSPDNNTSNPPSLLPDIHWKAGITTPKVVPKFNTLASTSLISFNSWSQKKLTSHTFNADFSAMSPFTTNFYSRDIVHQEHSKELLLLSIFNQPLAHRELQDMNPELIAHICQRGTEVCLLKR